MLIISLMQGVLRGDFGHKGLIATDCGALNDADVHHNYRCTS